MRRHSRRFVGVAIALAVASGSLVGCATSPEPRYFALAPSPGTAQRSWARSIELRRPGLAGYLDRSDIVRRIVDYRLQIDTSERWGEPFGDMISRVLAQDLAQRVTGSSVFAAGGAITSDPDAVIEVDVQRFDAGPDGIITLAAQVAIQQGGDHRPLTADSLVLTRHPESAGTSATVAAMSQLLGLLSDRIADMLRATPPPPKTSPP